MKNLLASLIFLGLVFIASPSSSAAEDEKPNTNWSHWRGPLGTGASPDATPPLEWSEEKNLRWKTPLPGLGHSSPVVWGDRIFLTSSIPVGEAFTPRPDNAPGSHNNNPVSSKWRFVALAVDRSNGKILWQSSLHEAIPKEGGHETGTLASASPVTDGERVYAFFGKGGVIEGRVTLPRGTDPTGTLVAAHRGDGRGVTARVGADGGFRFELLTPGPWNVAVRENGAALRSHSSSPAVSGYEDEVEWNCQVVAGQTTFHDLELADPRTFVFEGRVRVEGVSSSSFTAFLCSPSADFYSSRGGWESVTPAPRKLTSLSFLSSQSAKAAVDALSRSERVFAS